MDRKISAYQENDTLLIKAYSLSDKLLKHTAKLIPVFEGPNLIGKIIREGMYLIIDHRNHKKRGIFHANDLQKYHN